MGNLKECLGKKMFRKKVSSRKHRPDQFKHTPENLFFRLSNSIQKVQLFTCFNFFTSCSRFTAETSSSRCLLVSCCLWVRNATLAMNNNVMNVKGEQIREQHPEDCGMSSRSLRRSSHFGESDPMLSEFLRLIF